MPRASTAPSLQIGRMDVPLEIDAEFNSWYNTIYIPNYEKVPGVIRGRRFRALTGTPTYLTLYEFEHPKVSESARGRPARRSPVTQRIRPHMRHARARRRLRQDFSSRRPPRGQPHHLGRDRAGSPRR